MTSGNQDAAFCFHEDNFIRSRKWKRALNLYIYIYTIALELAFKKQRNIYPGLMLVSMDNFSSLCGREMR